MPEAEVDALPQLQHIQLRYQLLVRQPAGQRLQPLLTRVKVCGPQSTRELGIASTQGIWLLLLLLLLWLLLVLPFLLVVLAWLVRRLYRSRWYLLQYRLGVLQFALLAAFGSIRAWLRHFESQAAETALLLL